MRRSPSPLRATSSPSAERGIDVGGRPKVRSALIRHIVQEPEMFDFSVGQFVGSTVAQRGVRSSRPAGDLAGVSAALHPILRRRKYELSNKLL
jgi:hypothetical protein